MSQANNKFYKLTIALLIYLHNRVRRNDFLLFLFLDRTAFQVRLDAVLFTPLLYGQATCLLCFNQLRPFLRAYRLSDRCDLCCFILHNAPSCVQFTPIYYIEFFWNLQFTPSSFLKLIIHHWTARGKTLNILTLTLFIQALLSLHPPSG